jgi:putative redox protein
VSNKAPTVVDLVWDHDLQFRVAFGGSPSTSSSLVLDSAGLAGPSPVQALTAALAGCMAMDLIHILTRGRHVVRTLTAHLSGDRSNVDPRRLVRVLLHFVVSSDAPPEAIDRAIALSRDKYCSVWQSLRQDIELHVTVACDSPVIGRD